MTSDNLKPADSTARWASGRPGTLERPPPPLASALRLGQCAAWIWHGYAVGCTRGLRDPEEQDCEEPEPAGSVRGVGSPGAGMAAETLPLTSVYTAKFIREEVTQV